MKNKEFLKWHEDTLLHGEKVMSTTNCAICIMVRDCRTALEKNMQVIAELRRLFSTSYLIIIENDSKDGTKEFVHGLGAKDAHTFVDSFDTGVVTLPKKMESGVNPSFSAHRVQRMADYRNRYLKILKEKIEFDSLDWVMMIDPDVDQIFIDGIKHSFGLENRWDVVHANGRMKQGWFSDVYYDVYAFAEYGDDSPCSEAGMHRNMVSMKSVKETESLLFVRSGFNALAIYRAEALRGIQYRCVKNDDVRVEVWCEHVPFHDKIREAGYVRQALNPCMKVVYNTRIQALMVSAKAVIKNTYFFTKGHLGGS